MSCSSEWKDDIEGNFRLNKAITQGMGALLGLLVSLE